MIDTMIHRALLYVLGLCLEFVYNIKNRKVQIIFS